MKQQPIIALVGNPNCGKSTIFNALTGMKVRVGNWSGVTVDRKSGFYTQGSQQIEIVDLPGIYRLSTESDSHSVDERIASDYILQGQASLIVNIIDADNLERHLYLTTQLLSFQVPMIVVVNMLDVAMRHGKQIDLEQLSVTLGCPVIGLPVVKRRGISIFKQTVQEALSGATQKRLVFPLPKVLDTAFQALAARGLDAKQALMVLESGKHELPPEIETSWGEESDVLIASFRFDWIQNVLARVLHKGIVSESMTERLDKILLNRYLSIPIFLLTLYVTFFFAIHIGGVFQDFFDLSSQALFIEGPIRWMTAWQLPNWLIALVASGIGRGLNTTLTFIPIIGALFLALSFLESSGYMARVAFVMDRLMQVVGLPGSAFVPLIIGFGCNVPAIMASRTLNSPRDRILTAFMSPFMSCGARLAIFALFAAAFFPEQGAALVLSLYLIGIFAAIITAWLLKRFIIPGKSSPMILELPPYHWPKLGNMLRLAWSRLREFIVRAGRLIVPLCLFIGTLNTITTDGHLQTGAPNTLLSVVGQQLTPLFAPMGIEENNWPATVGLATGILAKEVVVATLNTLYSEVGHLTEQTQAAPQSLAMGLSQALQTIPDRIKRLPEALRNPLWASAKVQTVSDKVYGQMIARFNGKLGVYAYCLFVLLYFPCVSAIATMARELNRRWALFSVVWSTVLAYCVSVVFYQVGTVADHPGHTFAWIGVSVALLAAIVSCARYFHPVTPSTLTIPIIRSREGV